MKKRLVALFLTVLLAFSVIPAVSAAETEATETAPAAEDIAPTDAEPTEAPTEAQTEAQTDAPPAEEEAETIEAVPEKPYLAPTADGQIPQITRAFPSANGVTVSYTAYDGAARYMIFTKKENGGWKKIGESVSTSFEHKLTANNTSYTYTVRACDNSGAFISGYDKNGFEYSCLATPVLTRVESVYGGQRLIWNAVDGAAAYMVYISTGSQWQAVGITDKNYFVNENAESGKKYSYTVRCWDAEKRTARSFYVRRGISGVFIAAPEITSFVPVSGGVRINWNAVGGAYRYAFFVKNNGRWKCLATTDATSYTHLKLTGETVYTFTVRCVDKNGSFCSGYNMNGTDFRLLANPAFDSICAKYGGNYMKWTASPYAASYRIYRKPYNGKWVCIGQSANGEYTDTTAAKNTLFTYTLRAVDENGNLISHFTDTGIYRYNFKLANGKINVGGTTLNFKNGKLSQGYVTVNGKKYYYNSNGVLLKNTVVGNSKDGWTYADKNGVCCTTKEITEAADFLMTYCKGDTLKEKAKYAFMYLADNYPYVRVYFDTPEDETYIPAFARELFETKGGTCYRYAAGYACIARIAGYRARFCFGMSGTLVHGWTEVYVDGDWLLCDVDANIPSYGNADYAAYLMDSHFWALDKEWYSELTISDGKAVWGKKTYF